MTKDEAIQTLADNLKERDRIAIKNSQDFLSGKADVVDNTASINYTLKAQTLLEDLIYADALERAIGWSNRAPSQTGAPPPPYRAC